MADEVVYPQLSGLNWPSYILQVWLRLHEIGVPMENVRFLPDVGHYAVPEVVAEEARDDPESNIAHADLRHPEAPQYDMDTGELRVLRVDPMHIRPRLMVNVRADQRTRLLFTPPPPLTPDDALAGLELFSGNAAPNGNDSESFVVEEQEVGRLAHFVGPLMNGLDGAPPGGIPGRPVVGRGRAGTAAVGTPLEQLIRQMCARYPELMAVLPDSIRYGLEQITARLEIALTEPDAGERETRLAQAAQLAVTLPNPPALASAWQHLTQKLSIRAGTNDPVTTTELESAFPRFQAWARALFAGNGDPARTRAIVTDFGLTLPDEARKAQLVLLSRLREALGFETYGARERIVRELMEIMATEVFSSVAVIDHLWGMAWAHGSMTDICGEEPFAESRPARRDGIGDEFARFDWESPDGEPFGNDDFAALDNNSETRPAKDATLFAMTGGCDDHTLIYLMQRGWAESSGFLGLARKPGAAHPSLFAETMKEAASRAQTLAPNNDGENSAQLGGGIGNGAERLNDNSAEPFAVFGPDAQGNLDLQLFDAGEQAELWTLAGWRRLSADPLALVTLAVQRLVAPDVTVETERFAKSAGGMGTLFAQPGRTAVLGGFAAFQYPGVRILLPFAENANDRARRAHARLQIVLRLFLPVHFRVEIVWQEAAARLDRPSYLQHPFQEGIRLGHAPASAKPDADLDDAPPDPLVFGNDE